MISADRNHSGSGGRCLATAGCLLAALLVQRTAYSQELNGDQVGELFTGNTAEPNRVMAAQWDGVHWTEPETALGGLVGTLTWRLAAFCPHSPQK